MLTRFCVLMEYLQMTSTMSWNTFTMGKLNCIKQTFLKRFVDVAQRFKLEGMTDMENEDEDLLENKVATKMELDETEEVVSPGKVVSSNKVPYPPNSNMSVENLNEGEKSSTTDAPHQVVKSKEISSVGSKFQCPQCHKTSNFSTEVSESSYSE